MKKFTCKFTILVLLILLAAGFADTLSAQDKQVHKQLIGTWDLVVLIEGSEEYSTFIFTLENDSLTGVWNSADGELPMTNITLDGSDFTCEMEMPSDYDVVTVYVTGTLDGDNMKGNGEVEGMEYPFTATRRKEKH